MTPAPCSINCVMGGITKTDGLSNTLRAQKGQWAGKGSYRDTYEDNILFFLLLVGWFRNHNVAVLRSFSDISSHSPFPEPKGFINGQMSHAEIKAFSWTQITESGPSGGPDQISGGFRICQQGSQFQRWWYKPIILTIFAKNCMILNKEEGARRWRPAPLHTLRSATVKTISEFTENESTEN